MYSMEVDGNFYRAEKLFPYHDGDNAAFGERASSSATST